MPEHEFTPQVFNHVAQTAVIECKAAAASLQKPEVFWGGFDEEADVVHQALPLHQAEESVDITQLNEIPAGAFMDVFNSWTIIRGESDHEARTIEFTQYTIDQLVVGGIRRATYRASDNIEEDVESDESHFLNFIDGLKESAERGVTDDHEMPTQRDISNLIQAVATLQVHNEVWFDEYMDRRRAMTKEELRAERAAQFRVDMSEFDKSKRVPYWTIDTGMGVIFAAKADSPDMAAAIVDEYMKETVGTKLSFFWHGPIDDTEKEKFELIFSGDTEVVRLIPYSTEPWPNDFDNLTDAQQVAIDRLKRA